MPVDSKILPGIVLLSTSFAIVVYLLLEPWGCYLVKTNDQPDRFPSVLSMVCMDTHYKYLVPLLVPVGAYYIIANWVGWEYFRYG
ncbi:hypothetical protein [Phaffia rhodozyma]|uniref:Uncharacterized protein n=1 Tax=Phaffia rhodozyma TaxID=264483 RepID=A0A0F7SJ21_PHARH|nr:hypothetical protein [Phaffia rhodozyma]